MRVADEPATARAGDQADRGAAGRKARRGPGAGYGVRGDVVSAAAEAVFAAAVADFEAGRNEIGDVRDDIAFEDSPAPRRLAPYAAAMAAIAYRDGTEAGTGRLVLLYDPDGQQGWTGVFRLVAQVQVEVDPEMAADPLLGEVGWSWLTDALDMHAPGYSAPSGTVTRVITEGFGAKEGDPPLTGFELRASWCPGDDDDLGGSVAAWCELIASAAGLPPQPHETRALRAGGRRR